MSTEQIAFQHDPGATLYAAIFDSTGQVFDWNDNTFKAVASATTPGIALIERAAAGGGSKSLYTGSFNRATVNNTATVGQYSLTIFSQAGGSPAPVTDAAVSSPAAFEIRFGEPGGLQVRHQIDGCFTTTAGTLIRLMVQLLYDGQRVALETVDPTATCALAVREHGAGADLFTISATTVNAAGIFELSKTNPGYTADRLYKYTLTMVVNGVTLTFTDFLPNQG